MVNFGSAAHRSYSRVAAGSWKPAICGLGLLSTHGHVADRTGSWWSRWEYFRGWGWKHRWSRTSQRAVMAPTLLRGVSRLRLTTYACNGDLPCIYVPFVREGSAKIKPGVGKDLIHQYVLQLPSGLSTIESRLTEEEMQRTRRFRHWCLDWRPKTACKFSGVKSRRCKDPLTWGQWQTRTVARMIPHWRDGGGLSGGLWAVEGMRTTLVPVWNTLRAPHEFITGKHAFKAMAAPHGEENSMEYSHPATFLSANVTAKTPPSPGQTRNVSWSDNCHSPRTWTDSWSLWLPTGHEVTR